MSFSDSDEFDISFSDSGESINLNNKEKHQYDADFQNNLIKRDDSNIAENKESNNNSSQYSMNDNSSINIDDLESLGNNSSKQMSLVECEDNINDMEMNENIEENSNHIIDIEEINEIDDINIKKDNNINNVIADIDKKTDKIFNTYQAMKKINTIKANSTDKKKKDENSNKNNIKDIRDAKEKEQGFDQEMSDNNKESLSFIYSFNDFLFLLISNILFLYDIYNNEVFQKIEEYDLNYLRLIREKTVVDYINQFLSTIENLLLIDKEILKSININLIDVDYISDNVNNMNTSNNHFSNNLIINDKYKLKTNKIIKLNLSLLDNKNSYCKFKDNNSIMRKRLVKVNDSFDLHMIYKSILSNLFNELWFTCEKNINSGTNSQYGNDTHQEKVKTFQLTMEIDSSLLNKKIACVVNEQNSSQGGIIENCDSLQNIIGYLENDLKENWLIPNSAPNMNYNKDISEINIGNYTLPYCKLDLKIESCNSKDK